MLEDVVDLLFYKNVLFNFRIQITILKHHFLFIN